MTALNPMGWLFGAMFGGPITLRLGRRKAIMIADIIAIFGSLIFLFPYTPTFAIARFIVGIASGVLAALCPLYINEISPPEIAGKLGSIVQLQVTLGIAVSYGLALPLPTTDYNNDPMNYWWIFMFTFQGSIAMIQFLQFLFVYKLETPHWLLGKERVDELYLSLKQIYVDERALEYFESMTSSKKIDDKSCEKESSYKELLLFTNGNSKMMRLGCMINFFSQ